ncbi:MAG: hydroxymethylbilane synthase [Polyangiaceae bacterium]|nr:hydroxymethylbilane synthase [Polyangiaceae bacterium]
MATAATPTLTYATRRSALALAQSRSFVADLHRAAGPLLARELVVVTTGDRVQDQPLADIGGKGLFVREIEEALLDGRADFAVHSIKDVPARLPPGLVVACVPRREDPRDVLVAPRHRTLAALPQGARVGTSSLRRAVALAAQRPDLRIEPLRGNVDTRLRRVDAGDFDAIVLARAGLVRLGLDARATEVLPPEVVLPAVGQGALGIECRADDSRVVPIVALMNDPDSAVCVAAERGVLEALGGDCKTPLGAFAERVLPAPLARGVHDVGAGARLRVRAFVSRPDGSAYRAGERHFGWPQSWVDAHARGHELGLELAADGQADADV